MPGRDGTGPMGQGPVRGGGTGKGGRGRSGATMAARPIEHCVCPKCGAQVPHEPGLPCGWVNCPKCGANMGRGQ